METNVNTIQSGKYVVAYQYRYNDFVSGFQMYKTFDYADKGVVKFNDVDEARNSRRIKHSAKRLRGAVRDRRPADVQNRERRGAAEQGGAGGYLQHVQ